MPSNNNKFRRQVRQGVALLNEHDRDERTPRQQIDALNDRLGQGVGAKKERERLIGLMVAQDKTALDEVAGEEYPLAQVDVELAPVVDTGPTAKPARVRKRNRK
jgi:hypothetical protein